jgi:hypothetical protein
MAKKQTRRSVSISRKTYDRLKAHLVDGEASMSSFTEGAIDNAIDVDVELARRPSPTAVPNGGIKAAG